MTESSASYPFPLVKLEHVWLSYGPVSVLKDLSFCVERSRHIVLLGQNGSGKSSLLRLLQGELRPSPPSIEHNAPAAARAVSAGKIIWNFQGNEESSVLAAREHVRLVSSEQQANYVRRAWNISGEELLLSGLDNAPMLYGEVSSEYVAAAERLAREAGASALLGMRAPAMSQGQLRLMLILRSLMSEPCLLLLDEPFDGLDKQARHAVTNCLELAATKGSTLFVTAHRRRDIPDFISDALLLQDGRLHVLGGSGTFTSLDAATTIEDFETAARLPEPEAFSHASLSGSPFLEALALKKNPLIRLSDVDVFIDRKKVLSGINWQVEHGEHWVISGANGSGKSTLIRLLYAGEFAAWGGILEWCGGLRPAQEELRTGVGFVSDRLQHRYDYDISAEEVVISGLRGSIGLYEAAEAEEREQARYWLELLGVISFAGYPFHALSGGTARKVLLARALAGSPPVLLLDEPCTGLDALSRTLFLSALNVLARQGVTLIYASHHDEDKAPFFDHELRLEKGRVVFC